MHSVKVLGGKSPFQLSSVPQQEWYSQKEKKKMLFSAANIPSLSFFSLIWATANGGAVNLSSGYLKYSTSPFVPVTTVMEAEVL